MKEIMRIHKNTDLGIMEDMRVIQDEAGHYHVQTYSERQETWITQKWYGPNNGQRAIADCYGWYCREFKAY